MKYLNRTAEIIAKNQLTIDKCNACLKRSEEILSRNTLSLKEQLKDKAIQEAEFDGEIIQVETDDAIATILVSIENVKGDYLTPDNEKKSAEIKNFKLITNE
jgi:hypothetical protein